jgi:hypothetical protein
MRAITVSSRRFLLGSLTISLLGIGAPRDQVKAEEAAPRAAWTVMVYSAADCNLEEEMVSNVEEMIEIGGDAKLNIIVLLDRSPKGEKSDDDPKNDDDNKDEDDDNDGDDDDKDDGDEGEASGYTNRGVSNLDNWSGAKLLRVDSDHVHEIEDWGNLNTGDPAVLERFIRTAARLYPADRYALIVSDHGGGWTGACQDETSNDWLSLNEIVQALSRASQHTGVFEMVGFDACLMGTLEVTQAVAPFSKTFVASEDLVPGDGWNYAPLLRSLKKQPMSTGPSLGEVIADSFRDYFAKADRSSGSEVTLSVINPSQLPLIEKAMGRLSQTLAVQLQNADVDAWQRIARARARTLTFGGDGDDEDSSSLLDLVHLVQELRKEFGNGPVALACDDVERAVRAAVVHNVRGKDRVHANGLSIFFPPNAKALNGDETDSYPKLDIARRGAWLPLLSRYAVLADGQEERPLLKEIRADGQLVNDERNVTLKCKVTAEADRTDFAVAMKRGANYVILGRQTTYADDSNNLEDVWTGSCYTLTAGEKEITCPIFDRGDSDGDDESIAEVPVQIRRGSKVAQGYARFSARRGCR